MRLVMTLSAPGASDALDAHISYHLNAGVDAIIAAVDAPSDEVSSVLDSYVRGGRVHVVHNEGGWPADEWRARLARIAGTEYGADWIIDSDTDEFWWPRAESLADALLAIPPRYGVVQALVRRFLPASDDGPRVSRFTPSGQLVLGDWLRPVYRANSNLTLVPRGAVAEPWRVPMRAWYPIEVFEFATGGHELENAPTAGLVTDPRLVDALARLQVSGVLSIRAPDVVDDAAYAVECAALGEADFGPIEAHIEDLELRIAALEARFWPTVQRTVRRLVPRRR